MDAGDHPNLLSRPWAHRFGLYSLAYKQKGFRLGGPQLFSNLMRFFANKSSTVSPGSAWLEPDFLLFLIFLTSLFRDHQLGAASPLLVIDGM